MDKVVIEVLQGSADTQTMLGGLTAANFLRYMPAKKWLTI